MFYKNMHCNTIQYILNAKVGQILVFMAKDAFGLS